MISSSQKMDNGDQPCLQLATVFTVGYVDTAVSIFESAGVAELTVAISAPPKGFPIETSFLLLVNTIDGTAPAPGDYGALTGFSLGPFNNSVRQLSFNVSIVNDLIPEDDKDFTAHLTLLPADQATLRNRVTVQPDLATVTILDDDVVVEFHPTTYTVTESEGAVVMFQIVKRTMTTKPVSVLFSTSPGTATATNDFIGRTGVIVTFASGETEQFVGVTMVNDNTLENTEEFTAVLNAIPGSTIGAADTATATITDDDSVVIQFDPVTYSVPEGGSTILRIVRVGNADIPVSVTISTLVGTAELADFTAITNQVATFQPGDTEQFVTFTSSTDTTVEGTEMLTSVLSNPSTGATLGGDTANISIMDVRAVVVEFDPTTYTVAESEGIVMFLIVKRTMTTQPVSMLFSTSPSTATDPADFTAQNNIMVTFAPSETKQNISVAIVNDDTLESTETFIAKLTATPGSMIGAADTATATIIDDDIVTSPESTTPPPESTTPPPESTIAPAESNSIGPIAGAVAAVAGIAIISFTMLLIVIIVTRSHRARFDLHRAESQGAAGGASEVKFKETIPMAECMAYGTVGTHPTGGDDSMSQSFPGGVGEVQQGMKGENEDAEEVYEPIPI